MDVDQLNIEIGVFLKRLRMHSERQNAQINEKTAELLLEAILHIDKLIANAEMIPTTQQDCVKFLFDLNDKQFDLRQYIMCRLCVVSYKTDHSIDCILVLYFDTFTFV